jgi:hypothetical protein
MKWSQFLRSFALVAITVLAVPVFAKNLSGTVSRIITLSHSAKVGNAQLKPGEYSLLVDGDRVTVKKGNKVIAETQGRWVDRNEKPADDAVVVGSDGNVQEFRFEGDRRVLVLSE